MLEEGLNIRVLLLPDGEDPDSFARKHNASDFIEFVNENSVDFIRFKTNLLLDDAGKDPVKRAGLVQDIVRSIAIIPNQLIRSEYVKECSTLLEVNEQMLYHEISKIKNKEFQAQLIRPGETHSDDKKPPMKPENPERFNAIAQGKFAREEEHLVRLLIKFGGQTLYYSPDEDGENEIAYTVADYVLNELAQDGLSFQNPVFEKIRIEYSKNNSDANFNTINHFLYHTDVEVSKRVADLIAEKYTLSKVHNKYHKSKTDEERLDEIAPRYMLEYKLAVIMNNRKDKLLEMKQAFEGQDTTKMDLIRKDIEKIDQLKQILSKELDRVLNLL